MAETAANVPIATNGRAADPNWPSPVLAEYCPEIARPGYAAVEAHEYEEAHGVMSAKIGLLVEMLRSSAYTTLYTGAGISTASGISDYATKTKKQPEKKRPSGFAAEPTLCHRVLVALHRAGLCHEWVQQNHDGLPQKAGLPQEALNEIHGSWFDPSNPVVPMTGTLRSDLCERLERAEERSTLCIALGTSLCGMNADRLVETAATRAASGEGGCLGSVIVGLQRTQHDDECSLRFFCRADDFAAALAAALQLPKLRVLGGGGGGGEGATRKTGGDVFAVHRYCPRTGMRLPPPTLDEGRARGSTKAAAGCRLDLSEGALVRVTAGPGKGFVGKMLPKRGVHFRIALPMQREGHRDHGKGTCVYVMGRWWVDAAMRGAVEQLPIVNVGRRRAMGKK